MAWLPKHHYTRVTLRGVLPPCEETGEVGLSFDMPDGTVLRVRLAQDQARTLLGGLAALLGYGQVSQSLSSSGSPRVEGSTTPGQSVCPPQSSSSAAGAL